MVLTRYLLNKVDGFLWDTALPLPCPRFASPIQAEQVSGPAQEGITLDDMQRVLPVPSDAARQNDMNPVAIRQFRPLDLPSEDDQLLTQHRVLSDQVPTAARHVRQRASREQACRRPGPAFKVSLWPTAQPIPENDEVNNRSQIS